uniref:7TM GPCR serpentine receptor class x (Srx) domain-containing protein n=1 Tax=Romanomermis culicivorax TaxID=13658 RepID=A0A915KP76_ROMCU
MNNNSIASITVILTPIYSETVTYFVACWYLVFCSGGLLLVLTVLIANLTLNWRNMRAFYIFLSNLLAADSLLFCLYVFYVVPCVYKGRQIYGNTWAPLVFGSCQTFFFEGALLSSFLITVNRFMSIHFSQVTDRIFKPKNCYFMYFLFQRELSCTVRFSEVKFIFGLSCTRINGNLTFSSFVLYFGVYGVGFLYILSIRKLKQQYTNVTNAGLLENMKKRKIKIFLQAFCIWCSLLVNALAFRLAGPYITSGVVIGIFSTTFTLCPTYGSALFVLLFAKETRQQVARWLGQSQAPAVIEPSRTRFKKIEAIHSSYIVYFLAKIKKQCPLVCIRKLLLVLQTHCLVSYGFVAYTSTTFLDYEFRHLVVLTNA